VGRRATEKRTRTPRAPQPAERGRLALDERLPLRVGLVAAFAGVVAYASAMADAAADDPDRAVHEVRKALRRALAVVRLARPALGEASYRALAADLRGALRGTSPLRDAAVLLPTLRSLPDEPRTRAARRTLKRLLSAQGHAAAPSPALRARLRRSLRLLAPMPERLLACLPEKVRWRELAAGLSRSYRRTRRARRRAFRTGEDAHVHAFRKRVKELRYQLELLEEAHGRRPSRTRRELAALADALGEVTDLVVLRGAVRSRAGELPQASAEALLSSLDDAVSERLGRLRRRSRELFERSPADRAMRAFRQ
jgi:CHAD domain-containing protein